jgi:hypothetical protein
VSVAVGVWVDVALAVADGVALGVWLDVALAVALGVSLAVGVAVALGVRLGVVVAVGLGVALGVSLGVALGVTPGVVLGVGLPGVTSAGAPKVADSGVWVGGRVAGSSVGSVVGRTVAEGVAGSSVLVGVEVAAGSGVAWSVASATTATLVSVARSGASEVGGWASTAGVWDISRVMVSQTNASTATAIRLMPAPFSSR